MKIFFNAHLCPCFLAIMYNVGLSTALLSVMLVVSHNLCVRQILINNYGQYHFVNLLSPIPAALEIIARGPSRVSSECVIMLGQNILNYGSQ